MDTLQIAREAIAEISARFPSLKMVEDLDAPVELSITLPAQPGLKQKVWLALQNNDELHFSVSHLWLSWYPCTDSTCLRAYIEAVCQYLAGESRVLEHYRGKMCIKAELQVPSEAGWQTIGTSSKSWLPLFLSTARVEVRNA